MFSEKRIQTVVKTLRCLHEFGLVPGIRLLATMRNRNRNVQLHVPGYRAPIYLRTEIADISVFDKIFIQREYELPFPLKNPQLIIDGGANIGCSTVFFAQKYPSARIIAVEPERSNFELLVRNTRAYPQVTAVNAAIWPSKTVLDFTNTNYGKMAFQVREAQATSTAQVEAVTMADLFALAGTDKVDLLKLDIECAEKDLFNAEPRAWLDHVQVIVIELHDWIKPGNSSAFYHAISPYPFSQYLRGENVIVVKG
ncbi:MAG: FkbM family methyltransferase [Chloroflexales bacterium]